MSKLILEIQGCLAQEVQEPVNSKSVKCLVLYHFNSTESTSTLCTIYIFTTTSLSCCSNVVRKLFTATF